MNKMPDVPATSFASVPGSPTRLDYIDGFRGLAILLVLLYHAWEGAWLPVARWWNPIYSGFAGVNLFLLLSGFCLYWPFVRPYKPAPEPTLIEFARRRAHRLLPPYVIALTLCTAGALLWHLRGRDWPLGPPGGVRPILTTFVWHLLMLHNLRPEHIFTLDGPFWSLALEVSLYVAMPILVIAARRFGIGSAVGIALVVTLAYRLFCDRLVGGPAGWQASEAATNFVLVDFLPGQWVEFALGMWAAVLVAKGAPATSRLPFGLLSLIALALAAALVERFSRYNPFSDALYGLGFFLLLLQVSRPVRLRRISLHRGLSAAFRFRPLVWLGEISYSVYLIHYPLLKLVMDAVAVPPNRDRILFGINVLFLVPIVALAYLFHLYCEKPFINAGRVQTRPPAPAG